MDIERGIFLRCGKCIALGGAPCTLSAAQKRQFCETGGDWVDNVCGGNWVVWDEADDRLLSDGRATVDRCHSSGGGIEAMQ
jgi:hypothetical protein